MPAIQAEAALSDRKGNEGALTFGELLAGKAGGGTGLRLHAARGNRDPASLALAKSAARQAFQGSVYRGHFSGVASGQHLAPLAQDGSPTVNFFR